MNLSDFACWATGGFPGSGDLDDPDLSLDPNWGKEGDEFVADLRDLGNDVLLLMELKAEYLGVPHVPSLSSDEEEVYTLFDSMPELVDYTFGLDFSTSGFSRDPSTRDLRVMRLMNKFALPRGDYSHPEAYPDEDKRFLLPWETLKQYMDRRRVAVPYKNAVQSFGGRWIDPANPGGGRALDFVALARDQAANRAGGPGGHGHRRRRRRGWSTTGPSRRWPSSSPSNLMLIAPALPVRALPRFSVSWSP